MSELDKLKFHYQVSYSWQARGRQLIKLS